MSQSNSLHDVVVVGGGIAGLTVAHTLLRRGADVRLIEASDRVGGAMQTIHRDGFLVERGPNSLLDTRPEVSRLIDEAGLADARVFAADAAKDRFVVRDGVALPVPTSPGAFIRSPLFSVGAKFRLLGEPFVRRAPVDREESVADFVRRRLGREFLDYAIDPFVSGVYAGRADDLGVRHAFPRLHEVEQRYGSLIVGQIRGARERRRRSDRPKASARMFSFREGLETLPRRLGSALGDRLATGLAVRQIARNGDEWQVRTDDDAVIRSRAVVYAGTLSNGSIPGPIGADADVLKAVYYPPVTVLALGFRRSDIAHSLAGFGVLVPTREHRRILGALFSSTLFPGRAPEGHALLTVFIGGSRQPDVAGLPDSDLVDTVRNDLSEMLGISGDPVFVEAVRWPHAIPQYRLDYGRVKDALGRIENAAPGYAFAGNYVGGISVPDTVASAIGVAERIHSFVQAS